MAFDVQNKMYFFSPWDVTDIFIIPSFLSGLAELKSVQWVEIFRISFAVDFHLQSGEGTKRLMHILGILNKTGGEKARPLFGKIK